MQTFLPFADFQRSANVLDNKRLGKQILECYQIMLALSKDNVDGVEELRSLGVEDKTVVGLWHQQRTGVEENAYHPPYRNHPATLMWKGNERALWDYATACHLEWFARGYHSYEKTVAKTFILAKHFKPRLASPVFLGDEAFHQSHRAALYRKDPEYYYAYEKDAKVSSGYVWPRMEEV